LRKMTYNEKVRAAEKNKKGIDFKFNEDRILADLQQYVEATYDSHYAQTKSYQATEIIIDQGHGTGFCMGILDMDVDTIRNKIIAHIDMSYTQKQKFKIKSEEKFFA